MRETFSRYGGTHDSLGGFSRKNRKAIGRLLHDDEAFVAALSCTSGLFRGWLLRRATKLVLTEQRIIRFKRGWFRQRTEDYTLDQITSIKYDKGLFKGKIHLQGPGIDDDYRAMPKTGRKFVRKVREQQGNVTAKPAQ